MNLPIHTEYIVRQSGRWLLQKYTNYDMFIFVFNYI